MKIFTTHLGLLYNRGYQQAVNDFGITQLLSRIRSYSDEDMDNFQSINPPSILQSPILQSKI
ncbi:hypothetical protein CP500_003730 [Tychonema bourrellyi FEM_GT703]|uniref:Uncharacterized protein n=1 Tax=Tychonema bourrellyi FEM_GT703 TaxID=2040638 RepID=A0A2G4F4U7_9CYAN|nr:hypothetical protein CP500_003730 [Tychonema bourrellyi FEM_GT703]